MQSGNILYKTKVKILASPREVRTDLICFGTLASLKLATTSSSSIQGGRISHQPLKASATLPHPSVISTHGVVGALFSAYSATNFAACAVTLLASASGSKEDLDLTLATMDSQNNRSRSEYEAGSYESHRLRLVYAELTEQANGASGELGVWALVSQDRISR